MNKALPCDFRCDALRSFSSSLSRIESGNARCAVCEITLVCTEVVFLVWGFAHVHTQERLAQARLSSQPTIIVIMQHTAVLESLRIKHLHGAPISALSEGGTTTEGKYVCMADGSKYKGELLDVWRHGIGTCKYAPSGDRYKGAWLYNNRHGQGTFTTADGSFSYTGQWWDDAAHGYYTGNKHHRDLHQITCFHRSGIATYAAVGTYTGEFVGSQRSGWGTMAFADGSRFEGVWANDALSHGCMTHADGSTFVGAFEKNARAQGTLTSGNSKWQGTFVNGVLHGTGSCLVPGAYLYSGQWAGGKRHGTGRCEYADSSVYEGEWVDDAPHGQGSMTRAGGCYTGTFHHGAATGHGRLEFEDGSVYQGGVQDGVAHGQGQLVDVESNVTRGTWLHGEWQRGQLCSALTRWRGAGLACAVAGEMAQLHVQVCVASDDAQKAFSPWHTAA